MAGDFGDPRLAGYFDVEDRRVGTSGTIPFEKAEFPASFPFARWNFQSQKYLTYWRYFTGEFLEETIPNQQDEDGNPILKYPLQINYIKSAAMKHNYVLWGEVQDTPDCLAPVRARPRLDAGQERPEDDEVQKAKEAENLVNRVWIENSGRALQQESGLLQQFLGGIIIRVGWQPDDDELEYGIRLEYILPDFFLPVWDNGKPDNLLEAWIVYRMPSREAQIRFGFDGSNDTNAQPLYIEHWTKESISITLGGKPISYNINGVDITYDDIDNPFGFVPFVYIPRERAGSYYGLSMIDDLIGMVKEMNSRWADLGDVIRDTSHRDIFVRNVPGNIRTRDIGSSRSAIDLGTASPGSSDPEAFVIDPPSLAESLTTYPEDLRKQFMRDAFITGVSEGEDEGSQRSALTLAFRMWPLTAKVRTIRTNWGVALTRIAKMIVKMAAIKDVAGITLEHLEDIDWEVDWSPMVPRDAEQELNAVVTNVQTNLMSHVTAIEKQRTVHDPLDEWEKIKDDMKWMASLEASKTPQKQADGTTKVSPDLPSLGQSGSPTTETE
jgi:hypothetical protein